MGTLEKILEEIEQAKKEPWYRLNGSNVKGRIDGAVDRIINIIRKHMNDGWIPVAKRLPEEKINPVTQDFYEYQVTAKFNDSEDVRYYKFGNGHWWHGFTNMDKYVIAWQPRPEPYRPEESRE